MKTEILYGLPAADLVTLLNEVNPAGSWRTSGDKEIKGCCPFHGDSSPSFHLILDKQFSYCFGCGKHITDLNKLVAGLSGLPYAQSLRRNFIERFNLKVSKKHQEALAESNARQDAMAAVSRAFVECLEYAFNNPDDDDYSYVVDAIEYLQARGVPPETWVDLEIGVFPTRQHLHDRLNAEYRVLVEEMIGSHFEADPRHAGRYGGNLVFTYQTSPDTVSGFKLRAPVTGSQHFGFITIDPDHIGFWGLHLLRTYRDARTHPVALVEGEFDAIAGVCYQRDHFPAVETLFFAGSGGAIDDCDIIAACDVKSLVLLGDNDSSGTLFSLRGMSTCDHSKFRNVSAFEWPATLSEYKDVDAVVQAGKGGVFMSLLSACSLMPHVWARNAVQARIGDIASDNLPARVSVVKSFSDAIQDRMSKEMFLSSVGSMLGVPTAHLLRDLATPDTEDGYKELIRIELEKLVVPLAREGNMRIVCYSKVRSEMFDLQLDRPREVKVTMQNLVLMEELSTWCARVLGIPEWITVKAYTKAGPKLRTEEEKAKVIEQVLDRAVQELVASAPAMGAMHTRRAGVHYADATTTAADTARLPPDSAPQRLYIVNGNEVYVGHVDHINKDVRFEQLTIPLHGNYLFETDKPRWSASISTIADLSMPCTTNPVEMFDRLRDILQTAWSFECEPGEEDLQPMFLAAYMFTLVIASAFPQVMMVFLNAPSHSGKSTLMNGLFRGSAYPHIHLCEHVTGYDDYSTAGISQTMSGSSLCVTLDEFEAPDNVQNTKKKIVVQNFLEMVRNMGAGVSQVRGTIGRGEGKETFFRFPCLVAGIHPLKEDVDINRWNTIRLQHKGGGWTPPEIVVPHKLGEDKIKEYKRALTLLPIQNVSVIMHHHKEIERLIFTEGVIKYKQSRFIKNLLPTLAILKWLGKDWASFGQRYVTQYERAASASTVPIHEALFAAVFNTRNVKLPDMAGAVFTVAQILADSRYIDMLNDTACGVYRDPSTPNLIVVHMPTVITNLLTSSNVQFGGATNPMTLLEHLKSHALASYDPIAFVQNSSLMSILSRQVMGFKPTQVVTFKLSDILPALELASPVDRADDDVPTNM